MTITTVHVIGKINTNQYTCGRSILRHGIIGVVTELAFAVTFNIMRIVITPSQLNIEPIFIGGSLGEFIVVVVKKRRSASVPTISSFDNKVRSRTVHLVRLTRMDSNTFNTINRQLVQDLIKHLSKINHHTLVNLLPQVSSEDLNQGDFQGRNLTMHKNTCQIQLDLETNIYIRTVDCRRPPERKSTIGNLRETTTLGIGQYLITHLLFETRGLFPE